MHTDQIIIHRDDSIATIQKRFTELFPFLWIRVFKHTCGVNPSTAQDILLSPQVSLREINPAIHEEKITLSGDMMVSEVEKLFSDRLGLVVEVCLPNGNAACDSSKIAQAGNISGQSAYKGSPAKNEVVFFKEVPFGC